MIVGGFNGKGQLRLRKCKPELDINFCFFCDGGEACTPVGGWLFKGIMKSADSPEISKTSI